MFSSPPTFNYWRDTLRRVVDEVKNQVDAITTFPIETEEPIIRELIARNQVTDIAISGATDVFTLKAIAEQVRDELSILPEITQVDIVSAPPYEISIEVSETALRRHGMTFDQVADAVRRSSLDLPGGSVRTDGGEILLRTIGQAYRGNDYEDLVLWTRADGTRLRLGDVATVVDGFAETDQYARFDHDTTVMVSVFRTGDQSALDIAAAVDRYVEDMQARVPEGISLTIWQDQAEILADRLTLMARNGGSHARRASIRRSPRAPGVSAGIRPTASEATRNHTCWPSWSSSAPNQRVPLGSRVGSRGVRVRIPPGQSSRVPAMMILGPWSVMPLPCQPLFDRRSHARAGGGCPRTSHTLGRGEEPGTALVSGFHDPFARRA